MRIETTPPGISPALRRWLIALAVLIVTPWLIVVMRLGALDYLAPASPSTGEPQAAAARPGPWGRLKVVPIVVSPPLEYVSTEPHPAEGLWYLPGIKPDTATTFFTVYGLTPQQIATLQPTIRPEPRIEGIAVKPAASLVRGLSPDVRAKLYAQLARSPLNHDQAQAFKYPARTADDWLWGTLIAPETRAKVEALTYTLGPSMYFADIGLIRSELSEPELQRLTKVLNRRRSYLVKLTVNTAAEVEAAADYWGVGGRRTDIRAMLESISGDGSEALDIVHLLPNLGRNHLYRFPRITAADLDQPIIANCLWTALNFFSQVPDDRFLNVDHALAVLKNDYYVVQNNYRLGDIVAFVDEDGNIFHAAVYVADDIVFTKNGTTPMSPWALMKLDEVVEAYKFRSAKPRLLFHRNQTY